MTGDRRVLVVGGGIAGLAAAFRLQQRGFSVTVLEAGDHVGGRMWTVEHDGYRIDTGAEVLSTRYRQLEQLVRDAGLGAEVQPTSDMIGFLRDGEVHRLRTTHPLDGLRTKLLSPRAKLRMTRAVLDLALAWRNLDVHDLGRAARLDTEPLRDYATRRFPAEVVDYVVEPAATALSFGSADEISKVAFLWALRRVFGGSFFNSPAGMAFLPAGLARQLDVVLGATVQLVEERRHGVRVVWEGGEEEAAAAVIALPSPAVTTIYPQLDPLRAEILDSLRYAASLHVHFGLTLTPTEPAAMVFTPPPRHDGLCLTFFEHNKAPGRAPAGKGLVGTYWHSDWTQRHWDLDDDKVVESASAPLEQAFPRLLSHLEMTHVSRVDPCVVVNHTGLCAQQARFQAATNPRSRIQLAGDYFSSSATNTSVALGELAASRIAETLGGSRTP